MKLNVLFGLLLMMGIHAPLTHAVKMYKWVDEQGNVTYQDRPPPANASKVEEKHIDSNQGVTKFVPRKPTEPSSDYGRLREGESNTAASGPSTVRRGVVLVPDRRLRIERRVRPAGIPRGGGIPHIPHR